MGCKMSVRLIKPRLFKDDRGFFTETYNQRAFAERGIEETFVQDNLSHSVTVGTIRGLHFQAPPHAQAKLVRCIRGRIWDVAVDLRRESPTYGRWAAAELTAENGAQLFVPVGFAHGFCTLEPDTQVTYKVSDFYSPQCEGGIRWDDPALSLPWPIPPSGPLLSAKDKVLGLLSDFKSQFEYIGEPLVELAA